MIETAETLRYLGWILSISLVYLFLCAIHYIARWNIFKKAGIDGWKALIPLYTDYLFFKLAWSANVYWYILGLKVIVSISSVDTILLYIIAALVLLTLWIVQNVKLAEKFSKGRGFAIGLILLNPVFMLIISFGKSEYTGNREANV